MVLSVLSSIGSDGTPMGPPSPPPRPEHHHHYGAILPRMLRSLISISPAPPSSSRLVAIDPPFLLHHHASIDSPRARGFPLITALFAPFIISEGNGTKTFITCPRFMAPVSQERKQRIRR